MLNKFAEAPIHGTVAPGFEEVEAEFRRNFREQDELGAACTIYHEGEKVVDLWGGYRDLKRRFPWQEDTLVLVYSATKGLAGMTVAVAHSRGLLDYDERVATYWPEFAQNGKERITVRQLLAHEAGLSAIDERLSSRNLGDFEEVDRILAAQAPVWSPGTRHGYHALSIGWYEAALLRRVDPQQRSLGRFFAEEIARPLALEFYFGLPGDVPPSRVAKIHAPTPATIAREVRHVPPGMRRAFLDRGSLTARVFANPRLRSAA